MVPQKSSQMLLAYVITSILMSGCTIGAQITTSGSIEKEKEDLAAETSENTPAEKQTNSSESKNPKKLKDPVHPETTKKSESDPEVVTDVQAPPRTPTVPIIGGGGIISSSNITDQSLRLTWAPATDLGAETLTYRVCLLEGTRDLSDPAHMSTECSTSGWVSDFSANTEVVVDSLKANQDYTANVLVKNQSDLVATYLTKLVHTSTDATPPIPGGNGLITFGNITQHTAEIAWQAASDSETQSSDLQYKVCMVQVATFSDPATANAACNFQTRWSKDLLTMKLNGLVPGKSFRLNILVKDLLGNTSIYQEAEVIALAADASDYFVASDLAITTDNGAPGLNNGDIVSFDANGITISNLIFGTNAFSTLPAAVSAIGIGTGRITLGAGTFTLTSQLVVNGNISLSGLGSDTSVIVLGFATTDTGNGRGAILVPNLKILTISNLALNGSNYNIYAGIRSVGTLYAYNLKVHDMIYPGYMGIGLQISAGVAEVVNCLFERIGRVYVYNYGTATRLIKWNRFIGRGEGNFISNAVEIGAASLAQVDENYFDQHLGVATVDGSGSTGIFAYSYLGATTNVTAKRNEFKNTAEALVVWDGPVTVSFTDNSLENVDGVYSALAATVDATNNWWGHASGPSHASNPNGSGAYISGPQSAGVDFDPWQRVKQNFGN